MRTGLGCQLPLAPYIFVYGDSLVGVERSWGYGLGVPGDGVGEEVVEVDDE